MRARSFSLGGLPIAAYLGLLVALALASAFVAVLAIVIWLPPRPPDVMRADVMADMFQAGYDHMRLTGRTLPTDPVVSWEVRRAPPRRVEIVSLRHTQSELAERLELSPQQVLIAGAKIVRSDVFVFRVRDRDERRRGVEELIVNEEMARRRHEIHAGDVIVRRDGEPDEGVEMQSFEVHVAPPPLAQADPEGGRAAPVAPVAPTPPAPPSPPMFAPAPAGVLLISDFQIGAQLPDGRWLVMSQGRNRAELGWIVRAALIIGGTLAVLSLLAVLFARRLTRPIRNFSSAVQAVGVDPQNEPVREEGPLELRGAARAVNTMQARLRALIADRTKTLAAVAHDMRTPLMRLRLVAENAPPEQRERMAKEIGEVEALVASFIAFARDDPAEEARVRLDLSALLESIAQDHAEHGRNVSFAGDERIVVTGQSLGLKRLFANLVDNALKYGTTARIKLRREEAAVVVDVEDDGPGIPAEQRDKVFEPFVRLNEEGSRGAGLGLAAARSIARAHGGDIAILDAHAGSFLRVTLPG